MQPLLSIITPCLNAKETIRQTIESVLQQGVNNVEYIIIDGGSTDGTLDIVNEYAESIAVIVSESDQGISDAFNKGIALANGEYIGIINADDYYQGGVFEKIISASTDNKKPDIIHGSLRYIGEDIDNLTYVEQPNIERIWDYMSLFHPTMFIRKKVYQDIGNYRVDYHYAMDSEWVHRAIAKGVFFLEVPEVISSMRLGGCSHRYMRRSLAEFRKSAVAHGSKNFWPNFYFIRQLILQSLLNIPLVKEFFLWKRSCK